MSHNMALMHLESRHAPPYNSLQRLDGWKLIRESKSTSTKHANLVKQS
jgi:hypothetical protein